MAPKKIIQDIVPSKRRSIRDVTLERPSGGNREGADAEPSAAPRSERGLRVPIHIEKEKVVRTRRPSATPPPPKARRKKGRRWIVAVIAVFCCLAVAYGLSLILARATVAITPKMATVPVSGAFSADVNAVSPDLAFAVIATTTMAHMTVAGAPGPARQTYAGGTASLFNTTSASQVIIAGTRLADDRGLVYKTASTVTIPAAKTSGGKKTPGSVSVKIAASAAGAAYDSSMDSLSGDLAILAWKGTARAGEFYGRETSDMTGGSSGITMTVAPAILQSAKSALAAQLSSGALKAIQGLVPSDSILYNKAVTVTVSSADVAPAGSTTADVSMSASVSGAVFKKADLTALLAKNEIADFPANEYAVQGLDSLDFTLTSPAALSPATTAIRFSLSGTLTIAGAIDTDAIRTAVEGHPLADTGSIFAAYSSVIQGARVSIVPFWVRSVPSSGNRISVVVSGGGTASTTTGS